MPNQWHSMDAVDEESSNESLCLKIMSFACVIQYSAGSCGRATDFVWLDMFSCQHLSWRHGNKQTAMHKNSTHRLTGGWRRVWIWCSRCHPQAPHEVHIGVVHISFFRLPWDCSCHGKLRISLAVIDTKICSGAHWHRPTTNTFRVQLGWATLFYNHGNRSKARHDKLRYPCNYGEIWWYMHLYLEPKIPKDHTATEAPNEKHRLIVHSQDD